VIDVLCGDRLSEQIKIASIHSLCELPKRSQILLFAHRQLPLKVRCPGNADQTINFSPKPAPAQ
jgi:hypothetical protein